ncbi:leucine rich repeat family protein [Stylonychia lemnae]|uniref:Leucine rich repeat family protein n=1 Tax=Stylonychia lemnae TaxID=5949 RepID=A0A078B8T9_STYLE|nr:leucine rich repeat family protein [Stylonychia lemnae]|eukprot:CDW90829.1 leucine rich repeat family protein [Stylonychia lemnae]
MSTKALTKDMLLQKCKAEKLTQIKNVNLWGNDLDDLSVLQDLPNVEIVSLSLNKISTLRDFQNCSKLQELYLRKNQISDLAEVRYLQHLSNLRVLWLSHNPCQDHPSYRQYIIKILPNLIKLDNTEVTQEERQQAKLMSMDHINQSSRVIDPNLQRKPSQVNVLQQNNMIQNHQPQQQPSVLQSQSKSPFKGEINPKKIVLDSQNQQQQPIIQRQNIQHVGSSQSQQQQPQIIKKSHSVRPSSALNERSSCSVNSGFNSINVSNNQQQQQQQQNQAPAQDGRNENILCAVLALLKELGESELELVKRDIEKKIMMKQQSQQHHF